MTKLFILLILFQLKHLFADYPLQGEYMLGKFKDKGWVKPLLAHVAVHGFFTALIVAPFNYKLMIPLALLDMAIHFIMDRVKASGKMLGRYKPLSATQMAQILMYKSNTGSLKPEMIQAVKNNKYFWWSLGLDQMVHHLTHYAIIFLLMCS